MEYLPLLIVAVVLIHLISQKSTFINQMYPSGCLNGNVKPFPSGNIPGSYLGITPAERHNLLVDFIMDNPNI
jgi:hypothetical protein